MRRIPTVSRLGVLALILAAALPATVGGAATAAAPSRLAQADRLNLSVVAVEARGGGDTVNGSGTVIDADNGLVLTSARAVCVATSRPDETGHGILHGRIV